MRDPADSTNDRVQVFQGYVPLGAAERLDLLQQFCDEAVWQLHPRAAWRRDVKQDADPLVRRLCVILGSFLPRQLQAEKAPPKKAQVFAEPDGFF